MKSGGESSSFSDNNASVVPRDLILKHTAARHRNLFSFYRKFDSVSRHMGIPPVSGPGIQVWTGKSYYDIILPEKPAFNIVFMKVAAATEDRASPTRNGGENRWTQMSYGKYMERIAMEKRMNYIDVAKGLAILLVVYGHAAGQMMGNPFFDEHLQVQFRIIFSVVMPIFFIISGSFQRKRLESDGFNHKTFFVKVMSSLLLPFYSLSLMFLLLNLLLSHYINAPTLREMVYSLLLQQSNGDLLPSGVLWFLFTLFSFSIITYLFIKILKINHLIIIALALILRSNLNIWQHAHYFAFNTISHFFIYYIFGFSFYRIIINKPLAGIKYLSIFLLCYISLLTIASIDISNIAFLGYIKTINSLFGVDGILGSLIILGLSLSISNKFGHTIFVKIVSYYGVSSILVYVFHMPTFTLFKKVAAAVNVDPGYTYQFLLFLPGVVLPLVYGKILSCNKIAYKAILGRTP